MSFVLSLLLLIVISVLPAKPKFSSFLLSLVFFVSLSFASHASRSWFQPDHEYLIVQYMRNRYVDTPFHHSPVPWTFVERDGKR